MGRPSLKLCSVPLFAFTAVLLATQIPCSAGDVSVAARPLDGSPVVVTAEGVPLQMRGPMTLGPGDRIQTGSWDRVLVRVSGKKECRFILEPDSILELGEVRRGNAYRARLIRGEMSGRKDACRLILDVGTPEGRLIGENSTFSLRAAAGATTVDLRSGNVHFLIRGLSIPLRAMTRTTISGAGAHRITSIAGSSGGASPPSPAAAAAAAAAWNPRLPAGISPVSASDRP